MPGSGGATQDVAQEPIPQSPGPMRLVSWNCWNLFDDVLGNCVGYCPYEDKLTTTQYKNKIAAIAKTLRVLDGDIVLLQEVENIGILDTLVQHKDLADMGYQTRHLLPGNDPRGINIGLLSRVPVDDYISHKSDKFTRIDNPAYVYQFARDAVEIHLTYRGHKVGIVGVHFKARINDDDPDRRVAEAQQARAIADNILAADPNTYVFVMGDFNDTPGTDTYAAVRNGPTPQSLVFEHAMSSIPSAERYSYVYGKDKQLIDHILASPNAGARLDPDSAVILHDATAASDHHPLAATYTVP
ncbi:MAG: Endonuclease/Exonuclease/phosphatase family protein [Deltaproteobacteria bacterium ADurb.Bin207]|mgnify:FL=1|jgi:endonuclease/exonuclease/phosphatase family metal-dependent hydrolase|nr:MAG: Endonuclease/Exonuclease/phosphatase family protein [Deltaproteobacteria bacterium ADurb.Bin207]